MKLKFPKRKKVIKKKNENIRPDFYWRIILNTAFVFAVLFVVFAYFSFIRITKSPAISEEEANLNNPSISRQRIDNALKYFENRREKSDYIISSPSPVVDPAL